MTWRKVLADEVEAAIDTPLRGLLAFARSLSVPEVDTRPSASVDEVIGALVSQTPPGRAWRGPGIVRVTGGRVVLETDGKRNRVSPSTIRAVEHHAEAVWVRRQSAHDWLLRFEDAPEAEKAAALIRGGMADGAPRPSSP